jgi:hypothetical protein
MLIDADRPTPSTTPSTSPTTTMSSDYDYSDDEDAFYDDEDMISTGDDGMLPFWLWLIRSPTTSQVQHLVMMTWTWSSRTTSKSLSIHLERRMKSNMSHFPSKQ